MKKILLMFKYTEPWVDKKNDYDFNNMAKDLGALLLVVLSILSGIRA